MGFLVILSIIVAWYFSERAIKLTFNTSKRAWYKHESIVFSVIFYLVLIGYITIPFIYPDLDVFLLMPFALAIVSFLFSIEQYIYKKEDKIYFHFLLDTFVWIALGGAVFFLFR